MIKPVIKLLKSQEIQVTLVSLCEFRRMETPVQELESLDVPYVKLASLKFRGATTSTGKKHIGGNLSPVRNALRLLIWFWKVKPRLAAVNSNPPHLVVVPNDIAYPFDKICAWFRRKHIRFVLFQEGIRFPLPNEGSLNYGKNGPSEIFAWGKHSLEYFNSLGLKNTNIIEAGNPRFDEMMRTDYARDIDLIRSQLNLGKYNILYVSNPVDDQGFCTHEEKIGLFRSFLLGMKDVMSRENLKILVRLHPREDISVFKDVVTETGLGDQVFWTQKYSLFACLRVCDLSVVLASTVGLESMLNDTPVAVLKLGRYGHVFNYVDSGCALGIDTANGFSDTIFRAITVDRDKWTEKCKTYVDNQLSNVGRSALYIRDHLVKSLS